jgi:hypothetical protein
MEGLSAFIGAVIIAHAKKVDVEVRIAYAPILFIQFSPCRSQLIVQLIC